MAKINLLVFLFVPLYCFSQSTDYYLIEFTDKCNSPYSLLRPHEFLSEKSIERRIIQQVVITAEDLPVNPFYLTAISQHGITIKYSLKWINAAVVNTDKVKISTIQSFPFVKSIHKLNMKSATWSNCTQYNQTEGFDYGFSHIQNSMIGIDMMHSIGLNGLGVDIAFFDSGFNNADQLPAFSSIFSENRVKYTWDFVNDEANVYNDDTHGTNCWSICSGYVPGSLVGPAYKSKFYLFTTENPNQETLLEELNWEKAAEVADSIGVDIISSSLGYSTFDNASDNHVYLDLNGNSTIITNAADKASGKGILVINSAGNEGQSSWYYLLAPADGDSVIAVGAVDKKKNYQAFSSKGPSADGRIKPDLSALGFQVFHYNSSGMLSSGGGTSYSCPLITGFFAGMKQANPTVLNSILIEWTKQSSSHYLFPDNFVGYGIPSFSFANTMAGNAEKFVITPNPGVDNFRLFSPLNFKGKEVNLSILDVTGKKIHQNQFYINSLIQELPMTFLPSGMYVIVLQQDNYVQELKLIVYSDAAE